MKVSTACHFSSFSSILVTMFSSVNGLLIFSSRSLLSVTHCEHSKNAKRYEARNTEREARSPNISEREVYICLLILSFFLFLGEVTIITLGPLTNLALAFRIDPLFIQNVGEFISMGSTISGRGSIRPNVEFNFGCDPESNFIFFNSTTKPTILVPHEVALNHPISKVIFFFKSFYILFLI